MTCDCNGLIVEYSVENRFVGIGVLLFCFLGYLQMAVSYTHLTLKNGIRKRPSVTRQPAANILTWSATAVRGETFILPRFSTKMCIRDRDEVYLHPKATQMIEAFDKANQLVNDEVLTTTKA